MIYGIGTDIVAVDRLEGSLVKFGEKIVHRVLTLTEIVEFEAAKSSVHFLAKRWAAKEAAAKALGLGFRKSLSWQDITVQHDELGKPELVFAIKDCIPKSLVSHLSISDEKKYIVAFVVLEQS